MSDKVVHENEIKEIREDIKSLRDDIAPVIETFKTLRNLGKWLAILIAFLGSAGAALMAFKDFFKKT